MGPEIVMWALDSEALGFLVRIPPGAIRVTDGERMPCVCLFVQLLGSFMTIASPALCLPSPAEEEKMPVYVVSMFVMMLISFCYSSRSCRDVCAENSSHLIPAALPPLG